MTGTAIAAVSPTDLAICEQVALGRELGEIAGKKGGQAFALSLMRNPALAQVYQRAREMSSYALESEALTLLRARSKNPKSTMNVRADDLLANQLRWSATKRNPNIFSEKAAVHVTVPIQINTSLDMGDGAVTGTKEFPNIYDIEAGVELAVPIAELSDDQIDTLAKAPGGVASLKAESLADEARAEEAADEQGHLGRVPRPAPRPRKPRAISPSKAKAVDAVVLPSAGADAGAGPQRYEAAP